MRRAGQDRRPRLVASRPLPAWGDGRRHPVRPRRRSRFGRDLASLLIICSIAAVVALFGGGSEPPFVLNGGRLSGVVERVVDGDTLDIAGQRIRLDGLDAPEHDQTCTAADGGNWACGAAASRRLRELAQGRVLDCTPHEHDRYGRLVATCRNGTDDVAAVLVRDGLAIAAGRYAAEQASARATGAGLWQGPFIEPAAWRRNGGDAASPGGNPSRIERFLGWLLDLLPS